MLLCATGIICRAETMVDNEHELPITASRGEKENSLVGSAAQAFFTPPMSSGVPGWISGYVVLPPKAIKDAEGVGTCAQVRFLCLANTDYFPCLFRRICACAGFFCI